MISAIENAIVAFIKSANDSGKLGYKLKAIKSYGGEINDINGVVRNLPAVWVIFNSKELISKRGNSMDWSVTFSVLCAAKSLQSEHKTRHGAGDNVGSYQMIEDIEALLSNETLGLEIDALTPVRSFPVMNNKKDQDLASVYTVEFKTRYTQKWQSPLDQLDDFDQINVDWDIPPLGDVNTPLPSSNADATDLINLEQDP